MNASHHKLLDITDHSRDSAGLRYVYPVVSRRAGGVSIGINLNVNNACNWACIYCQVPDLMRGGPPPVDLQQLERELRGFLREAITGNFLSLQVTPAMRHLMDVAFSGNGEPTSATEFPVAVEIVANVLAEFGLLNELKVRLITNGSLLHRTEVCAGIRRIGELNGEVWFKVDRVITEGMHQVNGVHLNPETVRGNLVRCAALAPTWVQTCYFCINSKEPDETELGAYLDLIGKVKGLIRGVQLYGLARPSLQPDASRLSAATPQALRNFAARIVAVGVRVEVSP